MNSLLGNLPGVICYFDDVFVSGKIQSEHHSNLRAVLRCLSNSGIKLNTKCVFGIPRIEVLGHIVDKNGVRPNQNLVNGIADAATPSSPEQLRSFIVMAAVYREFVPHFASLVQPIRDAQTIVPFKVDQFSCYRFRCRERCHHT